MLSDWRGSAFMPCVALLRWRKSQLLTATIFDRL